LLQGLRYLCLGVAAATAAVAAEKAGIEGTYAAHARGVELARQGRHAEGLAILAPLLARFPNDYPLTRDVILVSAWSGDCDRALDLFERIRARARLDAYLAPPLADCAVRRARAGDYERAIQVLTALLPHAVPDYPLRRDLALISIWNGDCAAGLEWFDGIRDDERNPPYLIVPVTDCLLAQNRPTEALSLAEAARARYPADATVAHAYAKVQTARRVDANDDDDRPAAEANLVFGESDRGIRESLARAEVSAPALARTRLFARYLATRASGFDAGDMNRAGAGIRWRPTPRWRLQQEFSTDVDKSGLAGSHTLLEYKPYDAWTLAAAHHTYAEDISVRARAADIEARHGEVGVEYNRRDYVWYARANLGRYDFTDTNTRTSVFGTVGYAYRMLPEREQRVYLEWYQSRNTLDGAVYFNPKHDQSAGVVHRTDFVYDSRYKRHVDHLSFSVSAYRQEDFGTHGRWGVKYEQDYDFDNATALVAGVAFNRNVYDGQREDEWRVELLYRKRF